MSPLVIICFVLLGLQVVYFSLFLFAFLEKAAPVTTQPVPVSVIICAHDEEANLRELIPLLLAQDHPQFEIIVVEDRGNDGTYDYLLQATRDYPQLKMVRVTYLPDHLSGKKYGLTLGIKAAQYDWVLFTDADCRPNTTSWITEMSKHFSKGTQLVLGYSSYKKMPGLLNALIRFETFVTGIQYIAFTRLGKPYMGVGRNLAYRRSLFLENKGFFRHQSIRGGDDDLFVNQHANRDNTRIVIGSDALVWSAPKESWNAFYVQKVRHLFAGRRYDFISRFALGIFSLSWIAIWFYVVPVALLSDWGRWIGGGLVLRWIVQIVLFSIAPRKLGDRFEAWKTPILDFIYAFYYLVAGMSAAVSKKVRWRV